MIIDSGIGNLISAMNGDLRTALAAERPLQVVGVINAYAALQAQAAGFRAIYLSGAGVANAGFALPDLAMTGLGDVLEDTRRITGAVPLPLLVDADTGWGEGLTIGRTARELARAGAAAMHLEDQVQTKRCGHRGGKQLVASDLMQERIAAAVDGRPDDRFVVMARTDALAVEGIESAMERCRRYVEAGADMVFFEGATALDQFGRAAEAARVPVLANITEFGKTPLWTRAQLATAGVALVLYPLSGFRAMAKAAAGVFETIRRDGTQREKITQMQTRAELYETLDYERYEARADAILARKDQARNGNCG